MASLQVLVETQLTKISSTAEAQNRQHSGRSVAPRPSSKHRLDGALHNGRVAGLGAREQGPPAHPAWHEAYGWADPEAINIGMVLRFLMSDAEEVANRGGLTS